MARHAQSEAAEPGSPPRAAGAVLDRQPVLRWAPGADTGWALATVVAMWACYYANSALAQRMPAAGLLAYFVGGNLLVATVLPAWVISRRGEGWSGIGITRDRLRWALLITVVLGGGSLYQYLSLAAEQGVQPWVHLAYNMTILWEPLFVYGWLYLRFAAAFGWLPGVVLSASGFAAYHVGSVPWATVAVFWVTGLAFAAIMAAVRNLWVIFPLASGVSSGIGTLQSGLTFEVATALSGLVILLVQGVVLVLIFRRAAAAQAN